MTLSPLVVKRTFNAPQQQVFDAWTKPELMQQWLSPPAHWQRKSHNNLKVGGTYQHDMIDEKGEIYPHTGEYKEIIPPSKLVFTWNSKAVKNTAVTVELKEIDAKTTELTLTHEFFPTEELKNDHAKGWPMCFDNLENHFKSPSAHPQKNHQKDFHCEISINASPQKVFTALTEQKGLQNWWTPTCSAEAKVGSKAKFNFDKTYNVMEIEKLIPNKQVIWRCVDQYHNSPNLTKHDEWVGTQIIFNLKENTKGGTDLSFTHQGLAEDLQCYAQCFKGWTHFIKTSLKSYAETEQGQPYASNTGG